MRQFYLFLSCLLPLFSQAQVNNNSIGLGLGQIQLNPSATLSNKQHISIHSIIYNNQESFFTNITRITSPSLYIGKRIYRGLSARLNGHYQYQTFYIDYTGWIIEPDPGANPDKLYYNNINIAKTLSINLGVQYAFTFRRFYFYPALELTNNRHWFTHQELYTLRSNNSKRLVDINRHKYVDYNVQALLGTEYHLNKSLSLSYEMGLHPDVLLLLARLSLNCKF